LTRIDARDGDGEVTSGGSSSPPLPLTLPPHQDTEDDEDATVLPLTCGNSMKATVFELAAIVIA
jgi:hypothetical protein